MTVRLSQIPVALREQVADRMLEKWERNGVHPHEWMKLRMAAVAATPDVKLEVPRWKADLVLAGKQPVGDTPQELYW